MLLGSGTNEINSSTFSNTSVQYEDLQVKKTSTLEEFNRVALTRASLLPSSESLSMQTSTSTMLPATMSVEGMMYGRMLVEAMHLESDSSYVRLFCVERSRDLCREGACNPLEYSLCSDLRLVKLRRP